MKKFVGLLLWPMSLISELMFRFSPEYKALMSLPQGKDILKHLREIERLMNAQSCGPVYHLRIVLDEIFFTNVPPISGLSISVYWDDFMDGRYLKYEFFSQIISAPVNSESTVTTVVYPWDPMYMVRPELVEGTPPRAGVVYTIDEYVRMLESEVRATRADGV